MLPLQHLRRVMVLVVAGLAASWFGALPALAAQSYTIQPGDTLYRIAANYGVSVDAIAAQNNIANVNLIYVGETLTIPTGDPAPAAAPQSAASPTPLSTYTLKSGDTLWSVAATHGTTVRALMDVNPSITDPNQVYLGALINLPPAQPQVAAITPQRAQIVQMLSDQANVYGLDPALVQALAWQESGWQQSVVSASGAIGIMQVLPETGAWVSSQIVGRPLDVSGSAADNIVAGVAYLRWLNDRFITTDMTLAAYYQGPGSIKREGIYADTMRYVQNVLAIRDFILQQGAPPAS